jgi:hypothetical protein
MVEQHPFQPFSLAKGRGGGAAHEAFALARKAFAAAQA